MTRDGNVGIGNTSPSKPLTVAGDISGSGQVYAVSASFGSLTSATRWNDGWHGNDEFIALTPSDFLLHDNIATREYGPYTSDAGGSVSLNSATVNFYATKMIPKGFTATDVYVYTNVLITGGVDVSEGNIATVVVTSKASGQNTGTKFSITNVAGTGDNYIIIKVNPAATTDDILGAKIFIQRT